MVDITKIKEPLSISIGAFDGVHLGHRKVISEAIKQASLRNTKSAVLTFDTPPKYVLQGKKLKLLTTEEEKRERIKSLGIDYYIAIAFTKAFSSLSAEEFIKRYILTNHIKAVIVGFNFSFGYRAEGTPQKLKELCESKDIDVIVIPPLKIGEKIVSSTLIRKFILDGKVTEAKRFLGYNYEITGKVARGWKIGEKLGIPTANLWVPTLKMLPKNGVYAVKVKIGEKKYGGACNIGHNPTIPGKDKSVEVHIIDFSEDIYDRTIKVEFLQRLREERKFESLSALSGQIKKDIEAAKKICKGEG